MHAQSLGSARRATKSRLSRRSQSASTSFTKQILHGQFATTVRAKGGDGRRPLNNLKETERLRERLINLVLLTLLVCVEYKNNSPSVWGFQDLSSSLMFDLIMSLIVDVTAA